MDNYDNWKLSSPDYTEMVSRCCGDECEETENEVDGEIEIVCISCGDCCDIIEEYEYKEQQRESYEEMKRDGEKDEN